MRGLDASWLVWMDFLPPSCWLHFSVPFIGFENLDFLVPAFSFQGRLFDTVQDCK